MDAFTRAQPVYLDCNATTPVDERIAAAVCRFMAVEFGNAGSRTHEYGTRAKRAVQEARRNVGAVVNADPEEVVFTSGATESNNLALFGLAEYGQKTGRTHIISTQIEHKAVLEPLEVLEKRGFTISLLPADKSGKIRTRDLIQALRPETLIVSVMHVNNETGAMQPIGELAEVLQNSEAFFHVDAAQGFGKDLEALQNRRIDLMSVSGHKVYAPKGIGALITRRRGYERPPLEPMIVGGGQERGLRSGTAPVALIVGLGMAAKLALEEHQPRIAACLRFRQKLLDCLAPYKPVIHGDANALLFNTLNLHFPGADSEAIMVALKPFLAVSNGSACTSQSYSPSHVLLAMGLDDEAIAGAIRFSWYHRTEDADWEGIRKALDSLL